MRCPGSSHAVSWIRKGSELSHAANCLLPLYEAAYQGQFQGQKGNPNANLILQIHMLYGMAAECWLKAVLLNAPVSQRKSFDMVVKKSHKLLDLTLDCGLHLTVDELNFMERAQRALTFFGRYPTDRDGIEVSYVCAARPRVPMESITEKIGRLLPGDLRSQMDIGNWLN